LKDLAQHFVMESVHKLLKDRTALEAMEFLESSTLLQKAGVLVTFKAYVSNEYEKRPASRKGGSSGLGSVHIPSHSVYGRRVAKRR
jgi:hypothetical protein